MTDPENRATAAAQLKHVAERIGQWRATRRKGAPIPPEFWQQATMLASELGVYRVARALRLSYDGLKNRVDRKALPDAAAQIMPGGFIEVGLGGTHTGAGTPAVMVEVTDQRGVTLTVRLAHPQPLDVKALVDRFLEAR